ncbi:MAG TPA: hypothetical protein VN046_06905 [Stenotrophobium sp.]|jgi:hypothetical protein|nr:hypothetical protein [Stenotrophobium sp.]
MPLLRTLLTGLCLLLAQSALAREPVIVMHDPAPARSGSSTLNIQNNQGSHCEAADVGSCGSCAITCAVGTAAMCRPGKSVGHDADASCVRDPVCQCK